MQFFDNPTQTEISKLEISVRTIVKQSVTYGLLQVAAAVKF